MTNWYQQFSPNVSSEFKEILLNPEELIRQGEIVKNDKSTTVVSFDFENQSYILKRFNARSKGHAVKRALRRTRAKNCWQMSSIFSESGINVAEPIALLEARHGLIKANSYFICIKLEGVELLDWLPKQQDEIQSNVANQVQKIFSIFKQKKLSHGDMKASNLMWSEEYQAVFMIDLDAAKYHRNPLFFNRAYRRDKRRFSRNGKVFEQIVAAI